MTHRSFAATLWPASADSLLRAALLAVGGALLLTLSAKVQVPFFPVPMTLQTMVVLLIGAAFGMRLAVATVALYLAQGAFGLPVFANTPPVVPGLAYFLGPTGGFLAGFVIAAAIVGAAADRGVAGLKLLAAMLVADMALLAVGVTWLAFFATLANGSVGLGLERAFMVGVVPFLLGEAVKVALAAALATAGWAALKRLRG